MPNYIVSLTSYPERIKYICNTIDSLINQTYNDFLICLYLSREEFDDISEITILQEKYGNKLYIKWVNENLKSYKKIYYSLIEYPDNCIITVDDDVIYSKNMVYELVMGHKKNKNCVIARRCHLITKYDEESIDKYNNWIQCCEEYVDEPRFDLIATGVGGVLYPPNIFSSEVMNKDVFMRECSHGDDLWLKAMELLSGIKTVYVQGGYADRQVIETINTGLYVNINRDGGNDKQIEKLIDIYGNDIRKNFSMEDIGFSKDMKEKNMSYKKNELLEILSNKNIVVFGAGRYGKLLYDFASKEKKVDNINSYIVSNIKDNRKKIGDKNVCKYDMLEDKNALVYIAVAGERQAEILESLVETGYSIDNIVRITSSHISVLDSFSEENFKSGEYWNERYINGGNSGKGSYNNLAQYKADTINKFLNEHNIKECIEWGCGDGNQLKYFNFEKYIGYDISEKVIDMVREKYQKDKGKNFYCSGAQGFKNDKKTEFAMSLDVIYHLVEDEVFEKYIKDLFDCSTKFVCIYSSNYDEVETLHVRHRNFSHYLEENYTNWELVKYEKNKYPYDKENPDFTSFADFYFYKKME